MAMEDMTPLWALVRRANRCLGEVSPFPGEASDFEYSSDSSALRHSAGRKVTVRSSLPVAQRLPMLSSEGCNGYFLRFGSIPTFGGT